jgi:hypothetical protein
MEPPPGFELRAVWVEAGGDRIYNEAEWRDALVVVARGEIELECRGGSRHRLVLGDVVWLSGLPLRAIHNRRPERALLVAISRSANS